MPFCCFKQLVTLKNWNSKLFEIISFLKMFCLHRLFPQMRNFVVDFSRNLSSHFVVKWKIYSSAPTAPTTLTENIFRQIDYLVTSLAFSKNVVFPEFCQKLCVEITEIHFFGKIFVKVTVLLKKLLNSWFDEIFFNVREKSKFFRQINVFIREVTKNWFYEFFPRKI